MNGVYKGMANRPKSSNPQPNRAAGEAAQPGPNVPRPANPPGLFAKTRKGGKPAGYAGAKLEATMKTTKTRNPRLETWLGEKNRKPALYRPCLCGCGERDPETREAVGYLSGSDAAGNGFTLFFFSEEEFAACAKAFRTRGH